MRTNTAPSTSMVTPMVVEIITVASDHYLAVDKFGNRLMLPKLLRAKGSPPEPGESWVIDRSMGKWTLAAIVVDQDHFPIVLESPNGTIFQLAVGDDGTLSTVVIA